MDAMPPPPAESLTAPLAESASGEVAAWIAAHRVEDSDPAPAGSLLEAQEREIALALRDVAADSKVRARLARRMQDSDDAEGKMDLRGLMKDPALRPLADRLRRADSRRHLAHEMRSMMPTSGASNSCDVLCDDGSLNPGMPSLDVYMPIDEHRATWTGSEPFLVVPIVSDDAEWAIATGPRGERLRVHIDSVPPLHTFVVTPSEGHARSPSAAIPCIGVMQCWLATSNRVKATEEFITHVQTDDPRAPVLLGRPEFELHLSAFRGSAEVWERVVRIPEHAWAGRCLVGRCSRWNAGWRKISRGEVWRDDIVRLLDWREVPENVDLVTAVCVEQDPGFKTKVKGYVPTWKTQTPGFEIKSKIEFSFYFSNDDDECGIHVLWQRLPRGVSRVSHWSNSIHVPSSEAAFAGTIDRGPSFKWYGFGVINPTVR